MVELKQVAPMSEPRSRTMIAPTGAAEAQVFTVPYVLDSGRAKAILRVLRVYNDSASTAKIAFWDEDIDGSQPNAQRGSATAPIINFLTLATKASAEIVFQGDGVFVQSGLAVQSDQATCGVQVEYDLQM